MHGLSVPFGEGEPKYKFNWPNLYGFQLCAFQYDNQAFFLRSNVTGGQKFCRQTKFIGVLLLDFKLPLFTHFSVNVKCGSIAVNKPNRMRACSRKKNNTTSCQMHVCIVRVKFKIQNQMPLSFELGWMRFPHPKSLNALAGALNESFAAVACVGFQCGI